MCLRSAVALVMFFAMGLQAAGPDSWIPAWWPGGPLEVERRGKVAPAAAEVLREWLQPVSLDLLKDTPINCLLVSWSSGAAEKIEAEQQKLVTEFTSAAHARGVSVLGVLYTGASARRAVQAALKAGLDGLVLEGDLASDRLFLRQVRELWGGRPLIPLGSLTALSGAGPWAVFGVNEGAAPRVRAASEDDAVMATTTSEPWIESNTWLAHSLAGAAGSRPVWLGYSLTDHPSHQDYVRAIADAAVAGARWVVWLDDALQGGLKRGEPSAKVSWSAIASTISFYEQFAGQLLEAAAVLGVIQDFSSEYAELSTENLNLLHRRRIPLRVMERGALTAASIAGLAAVLATDLDPPSDEERKILSEFAAKGGILVASHSWARLPEGEEEFVIRKQGEGTIVLCRSEAPEPEVLAREMLEWIGPARLPVRLFNAPATLVQPWRDKATGALVAHLVNYASEPSEQVTVRARGEYTKVRLLAPAVEPAELKLQKTSGGVEARIERMDAAATLVFEK